MRSPGLAGSAYAALAGDASEDGPPMLDLAREAAVQRFVREAIARGLVASAQDVSGGGLAVALAECAMWGGVGREPARAGHPLARGRSLRRGSFASRPELSPALRRGADPAGTPARPAGRDARHGRWRSPGDRAQRWPARRARPRSAGAGSPIRSRSRSPTCATPGITGSPAPSAGRADRCVACSGRSCPAGSRPMPHRSPRWACSRSSIAARNRPASR